MANKTKFKLVQSLLQRDIYRIGKISNRTQILLIPDNLHLLNLSSISRSHLEHEVINLAKIRHIMQDILPEGTSLVEVRIGSFKFIQRQIRGIFTIVMHGDNITDSAGILNGICCSENDKRIAQIVNTKISTSLYFLWIRESRISDRKPTIIPIRNNSHTIVVVCISKHEIRDVISHNKVKVIVFIQICDAALFLCKSFRHICSRYGFIHQRFPLQILGIRLPIDDNICLQCTLED